LDIRKNFSSERLIIPWSRRPRDVMGSPSLEVLRKGVDTEQYGLGLGWWWVDG